MSGFVSSVVLVAIICGSPDAQEPNYEECHEFGIDEFSGKGAMLECLGVADRLSKIGTGRVDYQCVSEDRVISVSSDNPGAQESEYINDSLQSWSADNDQE